MTKLNYLIRRYPWLPILDSYFKEERIKTQKDFIHNVTDRPDYNLIAKQIIGLFFNAFDSHEYNPSFDYPQINPYNFILMKVLLYLFNDSEITNRVANIYSKIHYNKLLDETFHNLLEICRLLGLDVLLPPHKVEGQAYFSIHYIDYLRLSVDLHDKFRSLSNQKLQEGRIFIKRDKLIRLLQEVVRKKIIALNTQNKEDIEFDRKYLLKISKFYFLYTSILNKWKEKRPKSKRFDMKTLDLKEVTYFPPCFSHILEKTNNGINLGHEERLYLTWFLIKIEFTLEEIIDIFSSLPDFHREKTRYQIEFAMEKNYMVPNCVKLESLNLCNAMSYNDSLCLEGYYSKREKRQKKIIQPLTYVQIKRYRDLKRS